jgi:DNA mismatch endonuclease (patch repair protein)
VAKIRRNQERDLATQQQLARMGWHCITVWECELTPKKREETLESIAFTLNHIWLQDRRRCQMDDVRGEMYSQLDEEDMPMPMAAEELTVQDG